MRTTLTAAARGMVLGLIVLAGAASESRAATLRWRFKAGENLNYAMDQKTVTTASFTLGDKPQDIKTTLTQTLNLTRHIKSVDDQGGAEVTQTFTRLRTKIESPFGAFDYDSDEKKEPEGPIAASVVPILKALVGAEFSYKMSAMGELTDVKVPEAVTKVLQEAGGKGGPAGAGPFSEEGLKNMISEASLALPKEDLAQGKTWTSTAKAPTPPIGTMIIDKVFRYEGPDEKADAHVERIAVETKVKLEPAAESKLKVTIKSQDGQGHFDFDNNAGRVVNSHVSEKMVMLINVMNMDVTQKVETTTDMKLVPAGASK